MNHSTVPNSSQLLRQLTQHEGETITIGEIVTRFREGGFSLLLIVFATPLALPLPALGVAQVMALPIMFLSAQLMVGRASPWLPKKISSKRMKMEHLCKVVEIAIPWLEKIEYFLHPRFTWLSRRLGHQFTGIICVVCAISVAMPFPFSNTVPSMGIVLMSLGLLERDGVVIVGGMGIGLAGVCLAIAVLYFGAEAVKMFFGL